MATTKPTLSNSDDLIRRTLRAAGIYTRADMQWYDKYHRFGVIDPFNRVNGTREYAFFTKPDLHIFKPGSTSILNPEIANMPIFLDLFRRGYTNVLKSLQYSADKSNPFMTLLANAKTSNIDLPGISADDIETSANLYGTKMYYRKNSDQSDENHDFSIEFEDSKYLEVYWLFKIYDEYERKKFHGKITPPDSSYTMNKILHDQFSIFKFIVGDEETMPIIHFSKLYGCYPKVVPRDAFSELPADGPFKFTVQFKCSFVEDMEPNIITDFNALTAGLGGNKMYNYDPEIGAVSGEWAVAPYITKHAPALGRFTTYRFNWKG